MHTLTIGRVAEICGVAHRTAVSWCARGLLPHFCLPGSKHRRVSIKAFADFLRGQDWPAELIKRVEAIGRLDGVENVGEADK